MNDKDWFIVKAAERGGKATQEDDTPDAYLAALRRAFVEHGADFVILDGHVNSWIWRSAWWALEEGLIDPRWHDSREEQYSCFKCHLTAAGKARLGIK